MHQEAHKDRKNEDETYKIKQEVTKPQNQRQEKVSSVVSTGFSQIQAKQQNNGFNVSLLDRALTLVCFVIPQFIHETAPDTVCGVTGSR